MPRDPAIHDHLTWLGYLQPDGLEVSSAALVDAGILYDRNIRADHQRFHLENRQGMNPEAEPILTDLSAFLI